MFSCCCAHSKWKSASPDICECPVMGSRLTGALFSRGHNNNLQCDSNCINEFSNDPSTYFAVLKSAIDEYMQQQSSTKEWDQVYFTGHSLGGALASLLAMDLMVSTKGRLDVMAVAFGSPGDQLFATRTGLLDKRHSNDGGTFNQSRIHHIGLSTDPIFSGTCKGQYSLCNLAGYVMETGCHVGAVCLLDERQQQDPPVYRINDHRLGSYLKVLQSMPQNASVKCHY